MDKRKSKSSFIYPFSAFAHALRLLTFTHRGKGLNWTAGQTLWLLAFTAGLPFFLYATQSGVDQFWDYFSINWHYPLGVAIVFLSLGLIVRRTPFTRNVVGIILLAALFQLIRFSASWLDVFHLTGVKESLIVWQVCAMAWYFKVSHISIRFANKNELIV